MKILIADDDAVVLALVSRLLTRSGHTVKSVGDGVSACAAVETERPDLAILDLLLPKRDGYSVLMHLRSKAGTRDLPVILLTSESRAEHETTAVALGAQAMLSKPAQPMEILEAVRRISEGRPVSEARS